MQEKVKTTVKKFIFAMENKHIWWNPLKPKLPSYFIDRKVCRTEEIHHHNHEMFELIGLMQTEISRQQYDWKKWTDSGFVFLVDPPGMGKSCAVTKLEMEMRSRAFSSPRIIIRVDLNKVRDVLDEKTRSLSGRVNFLTFLRRFSPYIPIDE